MRKDPTDRLLWAIVALGLFVAAAFVNPTPIPIDDYGDSSLYGHFRVIVVGGRQDWRYLEVTTEVTLIIAVPALVAGWLVQAGAVRCGLRLSGRTVSAVAADYDDKPPSPAV
jgi:hypothetical protein